MSQFPNRAALWLNKLAPDAPLLSLQNGVDNEPLIASELGTDKVIAGTVATAIAKPGVGAVVEEHGGLSRIMMFIVT